MLFNNLPETVLLISLGIGGFWCIFVCICHFIRSLPRHSCKNRARNQDSVARQGGGATVHLQLHSRTPLHHGVRPVSQLESLPLRPISFSRRVSLPSTSVPLLLQHQARPGFDISGFTDYICSILPEYADYYSRGRNGERGRLAPFSDGEENSVGSPAADLPPSVDMDEAPPPYEAVVEHSDMPLQPPAYGHLFPDRVQS